MSTPHIEPPDLPDTMTWDELQRLPDEIADFIELREGHPVWVADEIMLRHGPMEHQRFGRRLTNALEAASKTAMADDDKSCWQVEGETNVFLAPDKSSYLTPDFLVCHCLGDEFEWVFADDTLLVGEVLSPANTPKLVEAKKKRYAAAGIPLYWEVELARDPARISAVRAYALTTGEVHLRAGVTPLHPANYILAEEWTPETHGGIETTHPYPMDIAWSDLAF